MPDKLQKLQELMKLANNSLSVEEFLANFKIVVDYVKKIEVNLDKKVDDKCENAQNELEKVIKQLKETDQEYQSTLKRIEEDNQSTLSNLKKWALERVGDLFVKSNISQEIKKKLNEVDRLMEPLMGYKLPSTTDLVNEVAQIVEKSITQQLPKVPSIEDIENDLPKLGAKIRDALELLQNDERLDVSAIKGLDELIKKVEKLSQTKQTTTFVGGGSSGGGRIVKSYDLSDQLNGVTKVFSLPAMWRIISVLGSSAPAAGFRQTTDWVYDAGAHTLTFTSEIDASTTLAAGQVITLIFSE